jgi:hypothetical protein
VGINFGVAGAEKWARLIRGEWQPRDNSINARAEVQIDFCKILAPLLITRAENESRRRKMLGRSSSSSSFLQNFIYLLFPRSCGVGF